MPTPLHEKSRLADLLQHYIERSGKTQRQIAEEIGVEESYVSKMANGVVNWTTSRKYFAPLAKALGLKPEEVVEVNPSAVVSFDAPRQGPLVKPRLPEIEVRLEVPSGLQEAIEKYGDDYPELHLEANQRALTSLHRYGGANDLSSKEWFEVFMANRRWLVRADDRN